jgi:hypothetical protein
MLLAIDIASFIVRRFLLIVIVILVVISLVSACAPPGPPTPTSRNDKAIETTTSSYVAGDYYKVTEYKFEGVRCYTYMGALDCVSIQGGE